MKTITIKIYLTPEEKRAVTAYAAADTRSVSNLFKKALFDKMRRDKKHTPDGTLIQPPMKNLVTPPCDRSHPPLKGGK